MADPIKPSSEGDYLKGLRPETSLRLRMVQMAWLFVSGCTAMILAVQLLTGEIVCAESTRYFFVAVLFTNGVIQGVTLQRLLGGR